MRKQLFPFILASSSPQRKSLLEQMGLRFRICPPDIEEDMTLGDSAEQLVELLSLKKLESVINSSCQAERSTAFILAADTIVLLEEQRIGKPEDREDAHHILQMLSGRTHRVLTGLALSVPPPEGGSGTIIQSVVSTELRFSVISGDEIQNYLDCNEYRGAAGAYRIQGGAACFIEEIKGSYTNIMGLPLNRLYGILRSNLFWL